MGTWTRPDRPSRRPSCSNGGWRPSRVRKSASRLGAARAGMRSPTGRDPLAALPATGERATKAGRVVGVDSRTPEPFRFSHRPGSWGTNWGTESRKPNRIMRLRRRARRLPSRSCEFDSRRPLQVSAPAQSLAGVLKAVVGVAGLVTGSGAQARHECVATHVVSEFQIQRPIGSVSGDPWKMPKGVCLGGDNYPGLSTGQDNCRRPCAIAAAVQSRTSGDWSPVGAQRNQTGAPRMATASSFDPPRRRRELTPRS